MLYVNPRLYPADAWFKLVGILASTATSLRELELDWAADWEIRRFGGRVDDLGADIHFIRAVSKIQGLSKLTIRGYYGIHWPEYLRKVMGCPVETPPPGRDVVPRGGKNDQKAMERAEMLNRIAKLRFSRFQEGTENLIP